jgi:3-hydroxyacyl-[acyl-carrier-protein] dehydratase
MRPSNESCPTGIRSSWSIASPNSNRTSVTLNERYLAHQPGEAPVLPPTILTEAVAQVGAIMILAKPENREKLIYFMGIERVRYRKPVHPGDQVVIEAVVRRLRSRMGVLRGVARVNGQVVVEGTMTFALGPRSEVS